MKKIIMFVLLVLSIGFMGCVTKEDNANNMNETPKSIEIQYQNILPADAKKRLESEKNIILLDVRTIEEYTEKHIPKSVLIPVDVIEDEAQKKLKDKSVPIFVYCRSGRRSVIASEALVKMGYTKVYNLGGIIDWPYEIEVGSK